MNLHISQWNVDLYQQQHSFVWKYGSSLLDTLQQELDPKRSSYPLRVLDVGCGSGELTQEAYQRYSSGLGNSHPTSMIQVVGMDSDENMIRRATKQNALDGKVNFFQADVCSLCPSKMIPADGDRGVKQELGLFDAIFSNACLHWIHDANSAVAAMASVLKPGGKFVVEFGGSGNIGAIVQATEQVIRMEQSSASDERTAFKPWFFPSIGEYSTILENHGIEVTNAVLYDRPTPLEDGENGMKNWINMFGGPLLDDFMNCEGNHLKRDDVIDKIVANLRRGSPYDKEEGSWTADYRRIRVLGQKK